MLLRSVPLLTQNPDPTSSYYGWKDGANKNYHPLTLLLFGTHRIERYLRSLAIPDLSHAAKLGSDGKSLKIPSFEFFHQDSAVASVVPGRSRSLTKRIIEQHILAETLGTTTKLLPLRTKLNDFSSAFLRLTEASFLSAYNTVQSTCLTEFPHDVGIQTLLEQSKNRSVGEQRRAFFDAYLRTETLKKVVANGSSEKVKLYLGLIRLLAFVGQPVEAATLDALKGTQPLKSLLKDAEPEAVNSALKDLKTLNLVSEIGPFPDSPVEIPNRYALHRALLHEIRDRNTVPISDARTYTSFNLPLYAAQPIDDHEPEQSVQEELEALVDTLIAPGPREDIGARPYGSRLRAAAASIRSYHTTSSMLMHEPPPAPYDAPCPRMGDHAKRLDDLIRAMEKVATAQEGKADQPKCAFPEDLVWLHDQRGVALLAQGSLYDARHALDQASTINDAFVEIGDHEQNWSRIEMNKLHLDIERGKISHAESRIRKIEEAINARSDKLRWSDLWQVHESDSPIPPFAMDAILLKYGKSLRSRIRVVDPIFPAEIILLTGVLCGYKGWCEYIRGRLKTSEHFFEQSIQILRNIGELRAYAMFMRHYTSVLYALDDREGAMKTINLCIAAADSARQMDISHLAWINRAELQLAFGTLVDRGSALRQMLATLRYATLTDMFRVRMETRRALAKLRLAEGDYDGALEQAAEAMAIATRFGYSLRKVSLRILIGQILVRRGDPISGYAMLDQATRIADRIGYQRAVEHAHAIRTDPSMPPAG